MGPGQIVTYGLVGFFVGGGICVLAGNNRRTMSMIGMVICVLGLIAMLGTIFILAVKATGAEFSDHTAEIQARQTQVVASQQAALQACINKLFPEKDTRDAAYMCMGNESPCRRYTGNVRVSGIAGIMVFAFDLNNSCVLLPQQVVTEIPR